PTIPGDKRRRRRGLPELLGIRRSAADATIAPPEPILRRLSGGEVALLEAADLFNGSTYRRTVGGIAKSLGDARASIVPLSGDADFAVDDAAGALIGFFSFKQADRRALDIGLGLEPGHTGQGLGGAFLEAGLDFARARFEPERFVLAVAGFNRRAITVYERAG